MYVLMHTTRSMSFSLPVGLCCHGSAESTASCGLLSWASIWIVGVVYVSCKVVKNGCDQNV